MTTLIGNQSKKIVDLLNQPAFINLARYFYWGTYSNKEEFDEDKFAIKIFDNNYENVNNLSFFYKIIKKLINDTYINNFNYDTYYKNELSPFYKGIFTVNGKFPKCDFSNNIEKCKFLIEHKLTQKSCIQENKAKITSSLSLLIKIYNEEKIKEQLEKYNKNPNKDEDLVISDNDFLPSKDPLYDGTDLSQGGYKLTKFTGGKPIQLSKEICNDEDLLNDISIFIKNYINEDEIEKFRCLKKLIDRKKKIDTIIKLYELIENEEKINKFKDLLVKVIQQIDTFFNGINQLFIKNSTSKELNKLGKYIYKSINGENYDDNSEDKAKDYGATNPNLQSIKNEGSTCYINSLLQAIRGCKPLLNKFLEIKEKCVIEDNNLINSFYEVLDLLTSKAPSPLNILPFCHAVWESSGEGQFPFKEMADSTDLLETIVSNLDKLECILNEFDFYNINKLNKSMPNYFLQIVAHHNANLQDALNSILPEKKILKPDASFIILRTKLNDGEQVYKTVKTKLPANGNITINNQTFTLSSVILNRPGVHYFTITKDGYFSDSDRILGPEPMKEFIKNSEYTRYYGNLYFFERVETQESSDQPQISTDESIVPPDLMEKYYNWDKSVDNEDFLSILDEIIKFILENKDTKFEYDENWKDHRLSKMWIMRNLLKPFEDSKTIAKLLLDEPYNKENLKRFFIQAKLDDPLIKKLALDQEKRDAFNEYEIFRKAANAEQTKFLVPEKLIKILEEYIDESKKLNQKGLEIFSTFQGGGKLINNKYFQKYIKYKNKYLELCKLKKNW
jgi:hypothetical protein